MEKLIIWQTYHEDSQIEQFHLYESNTIRLFKGNDTNIKGDNINYLNKFYSEIVCLYWVWKNNVKSNLVGFCHYRRTFGRILNLELGSCQVLAINSHLNVMEHYKAAHNFQDFYDIIDIINEKYGKDSIFSSYLMTSHVFIPFCCFIMNWDDFIHLCNFLFPILFTFDKKHQLNMSSELYMRKAEQDFRYDNVDYQCRAMSFLAERLISCWLFCKMRVFCLNGI